MCGLANRGLYQPVDVIPELAAKASKYYQKCLTCEAGKFESSCREYKRITNFSNYLVQYFPDFRVHLEDAQRWFIERGINFRQLKAILTEAKSRYDLFVIKGAEHHKQFALMNISAIWDSFVLSPLYGIQESVVAVPPPGVDDLSRAEAREVIIIDDFELRFDEESEFWFTW
jgi:hypothetical protein